jgi:hypothetical protein
MTLTDPNRLEAGDLLAALGAVGCAQAAQVYVVLGYAVVPMHAPGPGGGCSCPDPGCPDPGKHPRLRGWQRLAATDPALAGEWWQRWPDANLALITGRRFDVLDLDGEQGEEALRAALCIAPTEHPGRWPARAGEVGICCTPLRGWATGSGSCPGWTGGAAAGLLWPHPPSTPAAAATPGFGH